MKFFISTAITGLLSTFCLGQSCLSLNEALQVNDKINFEDVQIDQPLDLSSNLTLVKDKYITQASGVSEPLYEFDGSCKSPFHNVLDTGTLYVTINCNGQSDFHFINDVEHD